MLNKRSYHWYNDKGEPVHQVPNKSKGGMRATRLDDARKMNLLPSVTSVLDIVHNYGLEIWKKQQVLEASLTSKPIKGESDEDWIKRIIEDSMEYSSQAADKGTAVHIAIKDWIKDETVRESVAVNDVVYSTGNYVDTFIRWLQEMELSITDVEKPFGSAANGYGGQIDIIAVSPKGFKVIIDIKTQGTKKGKFNYYRNWGYQLAGYAIGSSLMKGCIMNVVLSTTEPGLIGAKNWTPEMPQLIRAFGAAYQLWCDAKNYYPLEVNNGSK